MLAKLWKKFLLAVCVIACIFNIMSKLVNRHSLRENLESANDGTTVFSIFQKDEVKESESQPIIEGVKSPEPANTTENVVDNTAIITEEVEEVNETEVKENTVVVEEPSTTEEIAEETPQEEKEEKKSFKFSDFTILF